MPSPITIGPNGPTFTPEPGDLFLVTGLTRNNEPITRTFTSWAEAEAFNLFLHTKYLVRKGRKFLISSTSPTHQHVNRPRPPSAES